MKGVSSVFPKGVVSLCAFIIFACLLPVNGLGASVEPIRIGAVFSLSGRGNFVGPLVGTPMQQAAKAVVDDINGKGGIQGRRIELFVEDDHTSPDAAASATTRLIREKKVSAVLGPSLTASAASMMQVCEQEQVPLIVTGPASAPFSKWVFLLGAGEARGAAHIAEFAVKTLHAKRIAILNDTSDYGTAGRKNLLGRLAAYPGISVVVKEQFPPADIRLSAELSRIKAANPDLLILYTTGASAAIIAREYKRLGMAVPVLGSHGVPTAEFLSLAGRTAEEHGWVMIGSRIAIAGKLPSDNPFKRDVYDPFVKLMKEKYGPSTEPSVYQAAAFDGITIAAAAVRAAGSDDRAAVRNALERIRWEGFTGTFACTAKDHQGSPRDDSPAMMVKNGEYVPYRK